VAMKVFKITLVVIILASVINAVRVGADFPILQSLPLLGGPRPLKYEVVGLVILCITAWVCRRLRKRGSRRRRSRYPSRQARNPMQHYRFMNRPYRNYRY
jgi:hypothetical protein